MMDDDVYELGFKVKLSEDWLYLYRLADRTVIFTAIYQWIPLVYTVMCKILS